MNTIIRYAVGAFAALSLTGAASGATAADNSSESAPNVELIASPAFSANLVPTPGAVTLFTASGLIAMRRRRAER